MIVKRFDIKKTEDLHDIECEWKQLEDGGEMTIFQSFDWNMLLFKEWRASKYAKVFSKVSVYIVYDEQKPVLILPLIVQLKTTKIKWFGRKKGVYILGVGSYSDYLNAVYKDISDEVLDTLFQVIRKDFVGIDIRFTDIVENTYIDDYLKRKKILPCSKQVSVAIKKVESFEAYNQLLSKHTKQNLRTALNRMNKDGMKYELKILSMIEDYQLLSELQQLHMQRMKEKELKSAKNDIIHKLSGKIRVLVRSYNEKHNNIVLESMRTMKQSETVIVKINSNIAGYLYCLIDGNTIRVLQNCVDEKYSFYSPMFRGIYDYITQLYERNGIQLLDFTRGNEEYKYKLGGAETTLNSYVFSPRDLLNEDC